MGEAFCLHPEAGLGVAAPDTLLVSQDFFAELSLPYSVKRGEVFPLNITLFNYIEVRPCRWSRGKDVSAALYCPAGFLRWEM